LNVISAFPRIFPLKKNVGMRVNQQRSDDLAVAAACQKGVVNGIIFNALIFHHGTVVVSGITGKRANRLACGNKADQCQSNNQGLHNPCLIVPKCVSRGPEPGGH
jgi:hypothetical protein